MDSPKSQKEVFLNHEGDGYFNRNKEKVSISPGFQLYNQFIKPGDRVLEIGCSSGFNLQYLKETKDCECYGIDPSREAIEYGREQFPNLTLSVGTADNLCFPHEFFDFILFGFCLYLVDRKLLPTIVCEADRALRDKGFIGITDFDAKIPVKVAYKHWEGVFSYKMDYSGLFLAFPTYSLAGKLSYSHSSAMFSEDVQERVGSVVLFKGEG